MLDLCTKTEKSTLILLQLCTVNREGGGGRRECACESGESCTPIIHQNIRDLYFRASSFISEVGCNQWSQEWGIKKTLSTQMYHLGMASGMLTILMHLTQLLFLIGETKQ